MSIQCSRGSRSFAKETRALKMRSVVGDHWKLTTTSWEQSLKLILLQLHEKLPMNSALTILLSLGIWGKLERWKISISECLLRWPDKKNQTIVLKCCLLVFYITTMNHFSIRLWHVTKSGFGMTAGDNQLSGWPEKKLQSTYQSQTCTKKWSWSLVVCCQADPLQFSESQRKHYIWEVCSANGWYALKTPMSVASTGQQKGPILLRDDAQPHVAQPTFQKRNELGYEILPDPPYTSHLLTTTSSRISQQLFAGKTLPQSAGGRKCFPRVRWILKHKLLCYKNKQTYFSLVKMCWL